VNIFSKQTIRSLLSLVERYFLFIVLASALILSFYFPAPGNYIRGLGLKWPVVVIIFFCQGLKLKTREMGRKRDVIKILIIGMAVSQILAPVSGYLAASLFGLEGENFIGFVLICSMAPTLISGTIIAIKAGGSRPIALLLAVGGNILAIPIIPINLQIFLGRLVPIPVGSLILKLTVFVLLPALAGHYFREWKPDWEKRIDPVLSFLPVLAYGLLIYMLFSANSSRLTELTGGELMALLAASLCIHLFLLIVAFGTGRWIFKFSRPDCRSLGMIAAQKTPSLSIIVWAITFAESYPLSIIPTFVFFLTFILADAVLAGIWSRRPVSLTSS